MDQAVIRTISDRLVNLFDIRDGDISIEDIAHGLSQLNRYSGQMPFPYSVAQHSVFVAHLALMQGPDLVYQCLMHDAQEATGCVDLPSPVKAHCHDYKVVEQRVRTQLAPHFRLNVDYGVDVHLFDKIAGDLEQCLLRGQPITKRAELYLPHTAIYLSEMDWRDAKALFLEWFEEWKPY